MFEYSHYISEILSCIRASVNAGPACSHAKNIPHLYFSCMHWFCAGRYCCGLIDGTWALALLKDPQCCAQRLQGGPE